MKKKPPEHPFYASATMRVPLYLYRILPAREVGVLAYLARTSRREQADERFRGWFDCPTALFGSMMGLKPATVSRAVGRLAEGGFVRVKKAKTFPFRERVKVLWDRVAEAKRETDRQRKAVT